MTYEEKKVSNKELALEIFNKVATIHTRLPSEVYCKIVGDMDKLIRQYVDIHPPINEVPVPESKRNNTQPTNNKEYYSPDDISVIHNRVATKDGIWFWTGHQWTVLSSRGHYYSSEYDATGVIEKLKKDRNLPKNMELSTRNDPKKSRNKLKKETARKFVEEFHNKKVELCRDERSTAKYWIKDDFDNITAYQDALDWLNDELCAFIIDWFDKNQEE